MKYKPKYLCVFFFQKYTTDVLRDDSVVRGSRIRSDAYLVPLLCRTLFVCDICAVTGHVERIHVLYGCVWTKSI